MLHGYLHSNEKSTRNSVTQGWLSTMKTDKGQDYLIYKTTQYFPLSQSVLASMVNDFERAAASLGLELGGIKIGVGEKPRRDMLVTIYAEVAPSPKLQELPSSSSIFG